MKKIVIATHHTFAKGIKDTLQYITGFEDIYDISAYIDEESLETQLAKIESKITNEDTVIFFTDMLGGSVNQIITSKYLNKAFIITGFNLMILMAIALANEEDINAENIQKLIDESKDQIILMNTYQTQNNDDDE